MAFERPLKKNRQIERSIFQIFFHVDEIVLFGSLAVRRGQTYLRFLRRYYEDESLKSKMIYGI